MWIQNTTGCLPAPTSRHTGRFLVPSPRREGWERTDTRGPAPGEEARREEQMVQATLTWKVSGATDTASQWGCAGEVGSRAEPRQAPVERVEAPGEPGVCVA